MDDHSASVVIIFDLHLILKVAGSKSLNFVPKCWTVPSPLMVQS